MPPSSGSQKLLIFLLAFFSLSTVLNAGIQYTFANTAEPTSMPDLSAPSGLISAIWNGFVGLFTGFSGTGLPSPLNWILSGIFWVMVVALVVNLLYVLG
jgi:hypothetical protein